MLAPSYLRIKYCSIKINILRNKGKQTKISEGLVSGQK